MFSGMINLSVLVLITVFVLIAAAIALPIIIYQCLLRTNKKYSDFLKSNSVCLRQLSELNAAYRFAEFKDFDWPETYDNENFFEDISCADYLIYQLQFEGSEVVRRMNCAAQNKHMYDDYLNRANAVAELGNYTAPTGKLDRDKLLKTEKRLKNEMTYRTPHTELCIKVTLNCSTINGRVYDSKSECFSSRDICVYMKRLRNRNGNFFNDRGIWDALCRVERGKVTNKMRFAIYARDGNRCRKCGISGKYARLEIDHIIPIAKGGKSTFDNLQTLCHKCNVEKGSSID